MTREEAQAFAEAWLAAWNRLDIDEVADHFASDGEMRSPLAIEVVGRPVVKGREAIRQYWRDAYAAGPMLNGRFEATSWDDRLRRLTVWWSAYPKGVHTRACEVMDFGDDGLIHTSEAYYGAAG